MGAPIRHRSHVWPTLALAGLALLGSHVVVPRLPLRHGEAPRAQSYPAFPIPGPDYFFVHPDDDELSQSVLYHALGRSIDFAREADVLFLGNSRMPLGLREEFLVGRAEALGVRLFSLGCGHSELLRFPLELIRRHDLRPSVVVANGGPHMYREGMSRVAREAMAMTRFDAAKHWLEVAAVWNLGIRLHAVVPRLDVLDRRLHSRWILYRSERTGWWRPVAEPAGRYPVPPPDEDARRDWPGLLPLARELREEVSARGGILVLTQVPYRSATLRHLEYLSEALGVPAILLGSEGVSVADGSHLDRASAELVSDDFWNQFVALPEVRRALSLPPPLEGARAVLSSAP